MAIGSSYFKTAATSGVISTTPCVLYGFISYVNATAALEYLQFFDLAVLPTTTATVPSVSLQVVASGGGVPGTILLAIGGGGIEFNNGCSWGHSSTVGVYTAVAGTDATLSVHVRAF